MKRLPTTWVLGMLTAAVLLAGGCAGTQPTRGQRLDSANAAYAAGDYATAYRHATQLIIASRGVDRDEANYLAGLCAQRMGNLAAAESHLQAVTSSTDRKLGADAYASLGLIHSSQGRYDLAARDLMRAAPYLQGQDQANAYFYAAIAQQKMGQWAQARTNLMLARAAGDAAFKQQVDEQLAVTGYTIQVGAFQDAGNARKLADSIAARAASLRIGQARLVSSTDSRGVPVTLVHVGNFATFDAAQRARTALGDARSIIVPLSR